MSSSSFRHSLKALRRASAGQLRSSTISTTAAAGASSSSSCRPLPSSSRISTRLLSTTVTRRASAEDAPSSSSAGAGTSSDAAMADSPSSSSSPSSSTSLPPSLISHIDPAFLPPALKSAGRHRKTLYEHLSTLPNDGVGTKVRQVRWAARGIDVPYGTAFQGPVADPKDRKDSNHLCYWIVTRARLRWVGGEEEGAEGAEGEMEERSDKKRVHGKVWGRFVWRGVPVTPEGQEERIRGGLKFLWDAAR